MGEPYVYVLLIVGLIFFGIFGQVEKRAPFPLVPIASMTADIGLVLACVACGWAVFAIWLYYTWQFIEQLRGVSVLLGVAQVNPAALTGLLAALTTGLIFTRVPGSVLMMVSLAAFSLGPILLATVPVDQTYWAQVFVSFFVMPFGMYVASINSTPFYVPSTEEKRTGICPSQQQLCCSPTLWHENTREYRPAWWLLSSTIPSLSDWDTEER
jgi:hypothetical protein